MLTVDREREFVSATADYFSDQFTDEFTGSSLPVAREWTTIASPKAREIFVYTRATCAPSGINFHVPSPYLAGAMVAATIAFSPSAFASETRPRFSKVDAMCVFTESEQNRQYKSSLARLEHLARKPDGWKGPESLSMPQVTKVAAAEFLRVYFSKQPMLEPFIGLDADGDVTLFWKNASLVMDLSILRNGQYSFYAEIKNGMHYEADEVSASVPLPEALTAMLLKKIA